MKKMLEGLAWKQLYASQIGCIHGAMEYMGIATSVPWLFGATTNAFLLNIHETLDVCGPTAWDDQVIADLLPNLGARLNGFTIEREAAGDRYIEYQRKAWNLVREGIDQGLPSYGWELHPGIPDFYVITGYDENGYYYSGCESGGPIPWQELGAYLVPILRVYRVEPCQPAPLEKVVKDSLGEVVRRTSRPNGWSIAPELTSGPEAYDVWAKSLENGAANEEDQRYNADAWYESRVMAVEFLREVAQRLRGKDNSALAEATAWYEQVRDRLKEITEQNSEAPSLLRQAKAAELEGLACLRAYIEQFD